MTLRYIGHSLLVVMLIGIDYFTKTWALELIHPIPIIPFFGLVVTFNNGVALGMFSQYDVFIQIFSMFALLGLFCFAYYKKLFTQYPVLLWVLLLSGGVGNSIDRITHGYVIDFMRFHFFGYGFICNFADVYLTLAVVMLIFCDFYKRSKF